MIPHSPVQILHYLDGMDFSEVRGEEWVSIGTAGTEYEAELICGRLRQSDIPATVLNQGDSMRPFTFGSLAVFKIMVPEEHKAEATRLYNQTSHRESDD
jgi:hypothetical protein